jgi:hypothetical protein
VRFRKKISLALVLPGLLCAISSITVGQSSEQNLPTPVLANDINGRIAPLDLGDPRATRHYYAFAGTPGDLLITIDSKNLNGDMDVFTAVTFRPLMKTSLYANSQTGEVTKGLYLRVQQILILRVEARTPNDEAGSYHVRFGGTFAPFSGGIPVAENPAPPEDSTGADRGSNRLSSVGATIPRPVVETAAVTSEPKSAAEIEKPAEETAVKKTTQAKTRPVRPAPTARNSRGRTRPVRPKPTPSDTKAAKASAPKTEETKTEAVKKDAAAADEKTASSEKPDAAKPSTQELPRPGAHLIIEARDGTKVDRPMSTIRRVVIEGAMIVIVLKTGRIERIPMSAVARMAIEP